MKKKILFVYDSMMTGGTSTALISLLNSINKEEYDLSLILYTNSGQHLNEVPDHVNLLEPAYIESKWLSSSQRKIVRTILNGRVILACKYYLKYRHTEKGDFRKILMHCGMKSQVSLSRTLNERYDIAVGFMEGWACEYVTSKKINAEKKFVWIHPQYKSCYLIPEIDRKSLKKVNGIALVSENCLNQFLEYFSDFKQKTAVVPNIISSALVRRKSIARKVFVDKAEINFCTVARCDIEVKGLDRIIKALYNLKQEGFCESVKWHFIGGGSDFDRFEQEISRYSLDDVIELYGNQLNPLPYLLQMDAFLLASRYEGKPVSVTEAQILGLPCLVTDYESAKSQVISNFNGLIMDNCYESIYEGLKLVISNPSVLKEWTENTKKGNFGNENDVDRFYDLLSLE